MISGPRSRELLAGLTDTPLGNAEFPWLRAREITLAGQPVRALRVSYVGELGWELHAPMASLPALYEALWTRGQAFGIADYGLYAVNSMRLEKAYKAWSAELTNEINMLEADMPRFIDLNKADFVGKAATLADAARADGARADAAIAGATPATAPAGAPSRDLKIAYAEVDATDTDARGGEPVLGPMAASAWSPRAVTATVCKRVWPSSACRRDSPRPAAASTSRSRDSAAPPLFSRRPPSILTTSV